MGLVLESEKREYVILSHGLKNLGNFTQDITVLLLLDHILVSQYNEYKVKKQLIQCHPFNVFSMNKGMFHRK